jgi:hypothetical protein
MAVSYARCVEIVNKPGAATTMTTTEVMLLAADVRALREQSVVADVVSEALINAARVPDERVNALELGAAVEDGEAVSLATEVLARRNKMPPLGDVILRHLRAELGRFEHEQRGGGVDAHDVERFLDWLAERNRGRGPLAMSGALVASTNTPRPRDRAAPRTLTDERIASILEAAGGDASPWETVALANEVWVRRLDDEPVRAQIAGPPL